MASAGSVCTSLQTDNHASTPPLSFLQAGCPSCHPTVSKHWRQKLYPKLWTKFLTVCQSSQHVINLVRQSWMLSAINTHVFCVCKPTWEMEVFAKVFTSTFIVPITWWNRWIHCAVPWKLKKAKSCLYSTTKRTVLELIPVLGSQPAGDVSYKPGSRLHYFPPSPQLPLQPLRGLLPISLLGEQRHDGCEQFA